MTEEISGPLGEWLADRVPKLAALSHRRFPQVPAEDFEQEIWARAYHRKAKHAKWLREDNDGLIWKDLKAAGTRLGHEDARYRRAVKAARDGYRSIDEAFYSTGLLAQLLPALIAAGFDVPLAVANASHQTDAAGVHIRAEDPEYQGNYQVILMDVCNAYKRLNEHNRNFLKVYYGAPEEDTDEGRWERHKIASSMGMTYDAFRQKAHRALRKLQRELGGEDPWRKQD